MPRSRILIVDDEEGIRRTLAGILKDEGFAVDTAETGEEALQKLASGPCDLVLLDVLLPGISGMEVLRKTLAVPEPPVVVMISGHGTIETAVDAIREGAYYFLEKPLSLEKTVLTARNALKHRRLLEKNRILREQALPTEEIIGESPAMVRLREEIGRAAPTNGRVLIFGENGTGKELVARHIHLLSARRDEPFVEVNCAAIPEELIESELFGHVKGSFTGAIETKKGKFAMADRGTLFLDEIGDMSLKTQAKVLRALQEQSFTPVGSGQAIDVDVRVIAATNKDLAKEIREGRFREDLYFRLNVIPLTVPPLRERPEDIRLLAGSFLRDLEGEYKKGPKRISREAMELLTRYRWPGNVRELRNVIERVVIMTSGDEVGSPDLPAAVRGAGEVAGAPAPEDEGGPGYATLREARDQFEKQFILRKLREFGGNVSRTAEALGMERSTFYRKAKALGIESLD